MWSLEELKSIDDSGSFDLIVNEADKAANGDKLLKDKIWSLEELKSIDDCGSFDLIVNEKEKAANGDKLLKLGLLIDSGLR
ncbi:hypothetical protein QYF36_015712 [Acer negundo]|nr:hypothetical protein QYF36_015712 [Acer negundo]